MAQASAEILEHTGPAEKKRVASVPQREQLTVRQSRFCQKEKDRAVGLEHQIVRRAFSGREVKRTAAEEKERDEYSSAEGSESQSNRKSHPNELFEN